MTDVQEAAWMMEIANAAVQENLNVDGSTKFNSAQGYACAMSALRLANSRTDQATSDVAVRALKEADDAIREMFRYFDGGETRGSYDGRPERNQLRKAGYATRRALASLDPTSEDEA